MKHGKKQAATSPGLKTQEPKHVILRNLANEVYFASERALHLIRSMRQVLNEYEAQILESTAAASAPLDALSGERNIEKPECLSEDAVFEETIPDWELTGMPLPDPTEEIILGNALKGCISVVSHNDLQDVDRFIRELDFGGQDVIHTIGVGGDFRDIGTWFNKYAAKFPIVSGRICGSDSSDLKPIAAILIVIPNFNSKYGVIEFAEHPNYASSGIMKKMLEVILEMAPFHFSNLKTRLNWMQQNALSLFRDMDFDEKPLPNGIHDFVKSMRTDESYCSAQ